MIRKFFSRQMSLNSTRRQFTLKKKPERTSDSWDKNEFPKKKKKKKIHLISAFDQFYCISFYTLSSLCKDSEFSHKTGVIHAHFITE